MITGEGDTRTVIVERQFAAPAEKLWRALTQPHLIEEWLMKTDFKPIEGHKFTLRKDPTPEISVVIDGEVRAVEENKTVLHLVGLRHGDRCYLHSYAGRRWYRPAARTGRLLRRQQGRNHGRQCVVADLPH